MNDDERVKERKSHTKKKEEKMMSIDPKDSKESRKRRTVLKINDLPFIRKANTGISSLVVTASLSFQRRMSSFISF